MKRKVPRAAALAGMAGADVPAGVPSGAAPPMAPETAAAVSAVPAAAPTVPVLAWKPCDDGFQCATARVPLNYRHPRGAQISIAVISHEATGPGPGRLPASQPLLAVPVDPGRLVARAAGPAHRRDHLAGPPSGGLKRSGGRPVATGAHRWGVSARVRHPLHVVLRRRARCTRGRASTCERRDTVRRVALILLPVMAAGMTLASCSSPTGPPGPTGTVTGTLQAVGGPPGAGPRALSGGVTLHGPNGTKFGIDVGANGRFSVPVTVGTYTVAGRSPQYEGGTADCHASGPVTVTKGVTSSVEVDCQEN
jgi:hypothetical protein